MRSFSLHGRRIFLQQRVQLHLERPGLKQWLKPAPIIHTRYRRPDRHVHHFADAGLA
jgi:hypothetical protein